MASYKCKMCGGVLEIHPGESVAVCDSCGSKQTIPNLSDERRANLYDRANHFRRANEFDKAMGLYEQILNEDNNDAEAHWSVVLCRYGIEYVEDPATHKRVPTVNRTQYTSIFSDEDYKEAIRLADGYQRDIYQSEAKAIDEIQKGILAISQREEPFDVFISYKETDAAGRRTPDSVLATDLYHQLTKEGFKVFLSRITLEDKLGQEYEPYIFAALHSAKVMVVVGTRPEYFNAVWVKNEWSRYLALIRAGEKKTLIPAYRDMDPYDLPEEFSHLMAQDMSKLGFMQDLIRGIKKICAMETPKVSMKNIESATSSSGACVDSLLKRAFMFLEDGDWKSADDYCERILDIDPENAKAYLAKLMAELHVRKTENLKDCPEPFDNRNTYQKVTRFADQNLKSDLQKYNKVIRDRNEEDRKADIYRTAVQKMQNATTRNAYNNAEHEFQRVSGYKDADIKAAECRNHAEACRKDNIYSRGVQLMSRGIEAYYKDAIEEFQKIEDWRDSADQIQLCTRKIEEIKAEQERQRIEQKRREEATRIAAEKAEKKRKRTIVSVIAFLVVGIVFVSLLTKVIIPKQKLNKALGMLDVGDYEAAYALLEEIGNIDAIASSKYDRAVALIDTGDYESAYMLLNGLSYKDSASKLISIKPQYQKILFSKAPVGSCVFFGSYEQDDDTSNGKEDVEWMVLAKEGDRVLFISRYALDCQQYNTSLSSVTWESCSLRKWLNDTFLSAAFSEDERAMIPSVTVSADKNPSYSTSPGYPTQDQVFLLSITEANQYFKSNDARICEPTSYAIVQGAFTIDSFTTDTLKVDGKATCSWLLRSPGNNSDHAALVIIGGHVDSGGTLVVNDNAVRPALWVNLGS